jgi:short-subunit dehydrogenase
MNFREKVVWITGASSGIGEALARAFSAAGAAVILSGRSRERLNKVSNEIAGASLTLDFDLTDFEALPAMVSRAWAWRGTVDYLVNCAGVSQRSLAVDTPLEIYRSLMDVNYFAPLRLTQLALPNMIAHRRGHIVAINSVSGKVGSPLLSGYCAAKHAMIGYFDSLRSEIELAYGIRVTVVVSGFVNTELFNNAYKSERLPDGELGYDRSHAFEPEEAASHILDGIIAGKQEITFARGLELQGLEMRASRSDEVFKILATMGAQLAELREITFKTL